MTKREEIHALVTTFVNELTTKLSEAAHEAVDLAYGDGDGAEPAPALAKARAPKRLEPGSRVKALPPARGGANGASYDAQILAFVRKQHSAGSAEIAASLGKTSVQIRPTLNQLVADRLLTKSGNGRATVYSVR